MSFFIERTFWGFLTDQGQRDGFWEYIVWLQCGQVWGSDLDDWSTQKEWCPGMLPTAQHLQSGLESIYQRHDDATMAPPFVQSVFIFNN